MLDDCNDDPTAYDIAYQIECELVDCDPRRASNKYWVTDDGRVLRYEEMTDTHLINAIKFMEQRCLAVQRYKRLRIERRHRRLKAFWTCLRNLQCTLLHKSPPH
jgi:hypothetical protein